MNLFITIIGVLFLLFVGVQIIVADQERDQRLIDVLRPFVQARLGDLQKAYHVDSYIVQKAASNQLEDLLFVLDYLAKRKQYMR